MSIVISELKKIRITDDSGETYLLVFKNPTQSAKRALQKASTNRKGNLDEFAYLEKLKKASLDLLKDVKGLKIRFEDIADRDFEISANMSLEDMDIVKSQCTEKGMEFYQGVQEHWKAIFATLLPHALDQAMTVLWVQDVEAAEASGE